MSAPPFEEAKEERLEVTNEFKRAGRGPARRVSEQILGLMEALSDLVAASSELVTHHVDLLRLEIKDDLTRVINQAVLIAAMAFMALLGYCGLLITTVLLLGWGYGIAGMAVGSAVLCIVHLAAIVPAVIKLSRQVLKPGQFTRTRQELEITKRWMSKEKEVLNFRNRVPNKKH